MSTCPLADGEESWIVGSESTIGTWDKASSDCDRGCGLSSPGQDTDEEDARVSQGSAVPVWSMVRPNHSGRVGYDKTESHYKLYQLQTLAAVACKLRDGTSHNLWFLKVTRQQPRAATSQQRKERTTQSVHPGPSERGAEYRQNLHDWAFYLKQVKHLPQWTIYWMRLNLWDWTEASPFLGIKENSIGFPIESKESVFSLHIWAVMFKTATTTPENVHTCGQEDWDPGNQTPCAYPDIFL